MRQRQNNAGRRKLDYGKIKNDRLTALLSAKTVTSKWRTENNYMTKLHTIFILTSLILFSCSSSGDKTNAKNTISDSLKKAFIGQLRQDSIDCQKSLRDSIQLKGLFTAFCPNDTIQGVPFSLHKKNPFDTLITKSKDTTIYSFKVSNECCVKYYGKYVLSSDTLVLSYNYCGDACDCYCDYILTYKIPNKIYKFKNIVIRNIQ